MLSSPYEGVGIGDKGSNNFRNSSNNKYHQIEQHMLLYIKS